MKWMWASKMLTCRPWWGILLSLVRCTELFFAFCREKKNNKICGFLKNVGKKLFGEKKDVFFIGAPIHCVYELLWILTKDMFLLVFFSHTSSSTHFHTKVIDQLITSHKFWKERKPCKYWKYFHYFNSWPFIWSTILIECIFKTCSNCDVIISLIWLRMLQVTKTNLWLASCELWWNKKTVIVRMDH